VGGACVFTPVSCDDGDACTDDTCDPATGCRSEAVTCDDGDACTSDTCDPVTGCSSTPMDCDDGDACTVDHCVDGTCVNGTKCDFDGDGDVDGADFASLYACLGPVGSPNASGACACMDLNGDGTIDLQDFGVFQMEFSGSK